MAQQWQALRSSESSNTRKPTPLNLEQLEARMLCTVNDALSALNSLGELQAPPTPIVGAAVNQAPTISGSIVVAGGDQILGRQTTMSVTARDDSGERGLTYSWSVQNAPSGGVVTFNNNNNNSAKTNTVTFNKPGDYTIRVTVRDQQGLSVTQNKTVKVVAAAAGLVLTTANNSVVADGATLTSSNASEKLSFKVVDQFGQTLTTNATTAWSVVSAPSGGTATFKVTGSVAEVTFTRAGAYRFRAVNSGRTINFSFVVVQTLTRIEVTPTPGTSTIASGAKQQYTASAFDQFNTKLSLSNAKWTASSGSITNTGLYTAPNSAANVTITASSGNVTGTAKLTVTAPTGLQSTNLSSLVSSLFADGSLNRADVMQILRSTGNDGVVDSAEFADLKVIVSNATRYAIPGYVQVLASNVVNGNLANATYQGVAAGNLAAGSSSKLLTMLVDKWFMGADVPQVSGSGITYRNAAGPLFVGTPSRNDELQGALGDCYFISAIGALADRNPDAVRNMFIDNGDGTFTVRFYTGTYGTFYTANGLISDGFTGAATADYVTVNRMLPSTSMGTFAYSNAGKSLSSTSVPLWIALAEKAYAQWNQTGKSNRQTVANSYASIEGGWMGPVNAQVLGSNSNNYETKSTSAQTMIDALNSNRAVTIGTNSGARAGGLVGSHAYSVIGYNSTTKTFQLHNPWGSSHPTALTWQQLQDNTSLFVVANATTSTPIALRAVASTTVKAAASESADQTPAVEHYDAYANFTTSYQTIATRDSSMNTDDTTEVTTFSDTTLALVELSSDASQSAWQPADSPACPASEVVAEHSGLDPASVDAAINDIEALLREALA